INDPDSGAVVEHFGLLPSELPLMVCPNRTALKRPTMPKPVSASASRPSLIQNESAVLSNREGLERHYAGRAWRLPVTLRRRPQMQYLLMIYANEGGCSFGAYLLAGRRHKSRIGNRGGPWRFQGP